MNIGASLIGVVLGLGLIAVGYSGVQNKSPFGVFQIVFGVLLLIVGITYAPLLAAATAGAVIVVVVVFVIAATIFSKDKRVVSDEEINKFQGVAKTIALIKNSIVRWSLEDSLFGAIHSDKQDRILDLLNRGARIQATKDKGTTPLHNAVHLGRNKIIELLLENNASVDAADNEGSTPLTIAVQMENQESVCQLLSFGANAHHRDQAGLTPIDWAKEMDNSEILSILRNPSALRSSH